MTEPFTILEEQFVRASLITKTDEEIAELMEKPVHEVVDFINTIYEEGAEARMVLIREVRERVEGERQKARDAKKGIGKKGLGIGAKKEKRERPEKNIYSANIEIVRKEKRRTEERSKFKTRQVDYSKLKRVKVDRNTWVYVERSVSNTAAIAKYQGNRKDYNKTNNNFSKNLI
jgi:hypothetical protein